MEYIQKASLNIRTRWQKLAAAADSEFTDAWL